MMMMYRSYLKNSGFHLIPASTIRDAQEDLGGDSSQESLFWMWFCDRKIPGGFWPNSNKTPRTRDIPVIIASTIEDQAKAFHLGADEYLLSPWSDLRCSKSSEN